MGAFELELEPAVWPRLRLLPPPPASEWVAFAFLVRHALHSPSSATLQGEEVVGGG
jgi:hypothetical protein